MVKYFKVSFFTGRSKPRCLLLTAALGIPIFFTLHLLNVFTLASVSSTSRNHLRPSATSCPDVSALQRKQLFQSLGTTSELLDRLHMTHFLCYKSLWAAAQESGPFPWDANADLCALSTQGAGDDEPKLLRTFRTAGLALDYSSTDAFYTVTNATLPAGSPRVQITLFEEDPRLGSVSGGSGATYRRVGWKRRLLPPNCDSHSSLECFPASLVHSPPLPRHTFGPLSLPVPRDDIDLLKFHYPDAWYKPVRPQC